MAEIDIDGFLEKVRLTRQKATYREYHKTLSQYLSWLGQRAPDRQNAEEFIIDLARRGLAPNSIMRHAATLKGLFRHSGLFLYVQTPSRVKRLPTWLEEKEMNELLKVCEDMSASVPGRRYLYPMVVTMLATGMRVSETLTLSRQQVLPGGRLRLLRKGNAEGIVAMEDEDAAVLTRWMAPNGKPQDRVFAGISYSMFQRDLRDAARMARIPKRIRPHSLRHTCGTMMARAGAPVEVIATQLGDTVENARIYIHLSASATKAGLPGVLKSMRKSN